MVSSPPQPRLSGHETFVCRYAWLPKVASQIEVRPDLFKDEAGAMVHLGVGKNMVRAIRFWAESAQILRPSKSGHELTSFGRDLLGHDGHDEFLERPETLWLIHWKITADHQSCPVKASK